MSMEAMNYVWKHSKHSGNRLLLLLAIADQANDDGVCFPGVDKLAEKLRCSDRYVQKLLEELEQSQELAIDECSGIQTRSGWTNRYTVVIPGKTQWHPRKRRGKVKPVPTGDVATDEDCNDDDCDDEKKVEETAPKTPRPRRVNYSSSHKRGVNSSSLHGVNSSSPHGVNSSSPKSKGEPKGETKGITRAGAAEAANADKKSRLPSGSWNPGKPTDTSEKEEQPTRYKASTPLERQICALASGEYVEAGHKKDLDMPRMIKVDGVTYQEISFNQLYDFSEIFRNWIDQRQRWLKENRASNRGTVSRSKQIANFVAGLQMFEEYAVEHTSFTDSGKDIPVEASAPVVAGATATTREERIAAVIPPELVGEAYQEFYAGIDESDELTFENWLNGWLTGERVK